MTLIKELIQIPEQVQQGDFVLNLAAGLEGDAAKRTLDEYVVTKQLAECFEDALAFVMSAVEDQNLRSKGAYLHGSFGSGKSHFMAVLHLLLQGNTQARSITELSASVSKHDSWMQSNNILLVPYHMIGAASVEAGVLGGYAKYIARTHPEASVPGFYQSDRLFNDAAKLRESFGDEAFFDKLNQSVGASDEDDGWGELASGWDAAGFDAVINGTSGDQDRARLVGDLISAFFSGMQDMTASDGKGFISFDDGLSIMTAHAKDLGYDAVILFLDELILWLASHLSNPDFINQEIQKIVKLVESGAPRSLPLISLIARQRDLKDFIGDSVMGVDQAILGDALKHWEGRFHTIRLADNNLPSIAEKRLLAPINDAARLQIDQAFETTAQIRSDAFDILLTRRSDRDQFRKLYPFSPAAIEALVALSSALQRERTALKVMLLLLVKHRGTLEVGNLIPVGDLYDVIAEEATPFSESMRQHFDIAQRLLKTKLIPLLESEHSVDSCTLDDGPADSQSAIAFNNDLRLIKTLLLSALVPEVECFQQLTAEKIAALNHGTIKSPIPGRESSTVHSKFLKWAGQVGEIRINEEGSASTISLQLVGVDTQAILENANNADNRGNRARVVKDLISADIGLDAESNLYHQHTIEWRGSKRTVEVLFTNIREIQDNSQFDPREDEWRVLIDFPFDEEQYTPADDNSKISDYLDSGNQSQTLCWLPAFLNQKLQNQLGTLVRLEQILRNDDSFSQHTTHLSPQDKPSARQLLDNQRSQLRSQIKQVLLSAYGVNSADSDSLQYEGRVEPIRSLLDGFSPNLPVGSNLKEAFNQLLDQALRHQFPGHPNFPELVKSNDIGKVAKELSKAMLADGGRVGIDQPMRRSMKEIAEPLDLGVMHENHFVFSENWPRKLSRELASRELSTTVENLRTCIDADKPMGLHPELQNLLIMVFAENGHYAFNSRGAAVGEFSHKNLDDNWTLVKEDLVELTQWQSARENVAAIFGIEPSHHLTGSSQQKLVDEVKQALRDYGESTEKLETALHSRYEHMDLPTETDANRLKNAGLAARLTRELTQLDGADYINALADIEFATDAQALGRSISTAESVAQTLGDFNWQILHHTTERFGDQGQHIRDKVIAALKHDELVQQLQPVLRKATDECTTLVTASQPTSQPTPAAPGTPQPDPHRAGTASANIAGRSVVVEKSGQSVNTEEALAMLETARRELQNASANEFNIEISISANAK